MLKHVASSDQLSKGKLLKSSLEYNSMYACVTADIERFSDGAAKYKCSHIVDDIPAMRRLLTAFCDLDIPSTLFVLGKYVHDEPLILDIIQENGHELASHGYSHVDLRTLPSYMLEEELRKSRIVKAQGFRAPYYGLDRRVVTYLDHFFRYDSSAMPVRTGGWGIQRIHMLTESLMEIPISSVGGFSLSSMGIRILPWIVIKRMTHLVLKKNGYVVLNVHPWEFVRVPKEAAVPFYVKVGTGGTFSEKFCAFLTFLKRLDVEFVTMGEVYELYR